MDENLIDCVAEAMRAQAEYKTGDDYFLRVVGDKKKPLWKELAKTAIEAIKRIADESNKHLVNIGIHTGGCQMCGKILNKEEMKPGGIHYCPGAISTQNTGEK